MDYYFFFAGQEERRLYPAQEGGCYVCGAESCRGTSNQCLLRCTVYIFWSIFLYIEDIYIYYHKCLVWTSNLYTIRLLVCTNYMHIHNLNIVFFYRKWMLYWGKKWAIPSVLRTAPAPVPFSSTWLTVCCSGRPWATPCWRTTR